MQVAPPFQQTRITHTQGLFVCNIEQFCSVVLKKKIFKGLHSVCYVQIIFGYCFTNNVGGATNFNNTYPRTICLQYLRILLSMLSSFGEGF